MFRYAFAAALVAAMVIPAAAQAQDAGAATSAAPKLRKGALVKSSDGKRIGSVYDIENDKSGTPLNVQVIVNDVSLIRIPAASLSSTDGKTFTTSMTYRQAMPTS